MPAAGLKLVIELDDKGSVTKISTLEGQFNRMKKSVSSGSQQIAAGYKKMTSGLKQAFGPLRNLALMAKLAFAGLAIGAIAVGANFEQSMANVASVAGATQKELTILSNTARAWGEQTAFSASEAADAMYSLASAGQSVKEIQSSVGGVLQFAGAAATSLGQAAETTVQAIKMFNLQASDTNRVINVFAAGIASSMLNADRLKESLSQVGATANAMNMDLEHTVGALGLLHNAGMIGSQAGTRLKNVLTKLADPNATLKELLGDVAFNGDNLGEVMETLKNKTSDAGVIFSAFGRIAGPAALAMMSAGREEMDRMTSAVTNTQKAMEMYEQQMNTVKSQFKIVKSALQENMIASFEQAKPIFRSLISAMIQGLNTAKPYIVGTIATIREWIEDNKEVLKSLGALAVKAAVAFAVFSAGAKIISVIQGLFMAVKGAMMILGGVLDFLKVKWIAMHLASLGPWGILIAVAAAAIGILIYNMIKYRDKTKAIMKKIGDFFGSVFGWIQNIAQKVGEKLREFFEAPINWIVDKLKWFAEKAGWVMEQIVPGWKEKIGGLVDHVGDKTKEVAGAVGGAVVTAFEFVAEKAKEPIEDAASGIKGLVDKVKGGMDQIKNLGSDLGGNIKIETPEIPQMSESDAAYANELQKSQEAFDKRRQADIMSWTEAINEKASYTQEWLNAQLGLNEMRLENELMQENMTEEARLQMKYDYAAQAAEIRMEYEDAVLQHWMENNEVMMMGLIALEEAYDTFFNTILDKEMTGKQRREEMWKSMKKSFVKQTGEMIKFYIKNWLKSIIIRENATKASQARERFAEAKLGAIRAYRAFASIPIIGPALGVAAAAAAFAFLMAFHQGGKLPGRDEYPILAQGGEYMVRQSSVTPQTEPALKYINATGKLPSGGSSTTVLNFDVNGGGSNINGLQEFVEDDITPQIEDYLNRGGMNADGTEVVLT